MGELTELVELTEQAEVRARCKADGTGGHLSRALHAAAQHLHRAADLLREARALNSEED